jgi:hypothetical protein
MATSIRHRLEQAEALIEEKLANYEKEMGSLKGELKRGRREAHKAKTELEKGNTPKNLALLKGKKSFLKMKLEAVENAHAEVLGAKDKLIALYNEEVHGVAGLRAPRVTARDAGQRRSRWPARVGAGRIRLSTEGGVACRDAALRYPLLWKSRVRDGRRHGVAFDDEHHEPAPVLQPVCTEPGRNRSYRAGGGRLAAAGLRGIARHSPSPRRARPHGSACAQR